MGTTSAFQFQTGAIKRGETCVIYVAWMLFQFQTGAIKSHGVSFPRVPFLRFNSKLVRLKVLSDPNTQTMIERGFNSKLVRLKVYVNASTDLIMNSFNSKLVRLKVVSDLRLR